MVCHCTIKNRFYIYSQKSLSLKIINQVGNEISELTLAHKARPNSVEINSDGKLLSAMFKDCIELFNLDEGLSTSQTLDSNGLTYVCQKWAPNSLILSLGASNGSIYLMNLKNGKSTLVSAKHSKKIISLQWSSSLVLASIAEDKTLAFTKSTGELEDSFTKLYSSKSVEVEKIFWVKNSENLQKSEKESICILTKKGTTLLIISPQLQNNFAEIQISSNYGKIISIAISLPSKIIIFTSRGFLVFYELVENKLKEVKQVKVFQSYGDWGSLDISKNTGYLVGDYSFRKIDLATGSEISDHRFNFEKSTGNFNQVSFNMKSNKFYLESASKIIGLDITGSLPLKFYKSGFIQMISKSILKIGKWKDDDLPNGIENISTAEILKLETKDVEIIDFILFRNKILVLSDKKLTEYKKIKNSYTASKSVDLKIEGNAVISKQNNTLLCISENSIHSLCPSTYNIMSSFKAKIEIEGSQSSFGELYSAVIINSCINIFNNTDLSILEKVVPKSEISGFEFNEQQNELYLFSKDKKTITIVNITQPNDSKEIIIPQENTVYKILVDNYDSSVFCIITEQNSVYTCKKFESHYRGLIKHRLIKDTIKLDNILRESEEDYSLTILDQETTPYQLYNGYLACTDKKKSIFGSYLSSHSFLNGSLGMNYENNEYEIENKDLAILRDEKDEIQNDELPESKKEYLLKSFVQVTELGDFCKAFEINSILKINKLWEILARVSLEYLNLEVSCRAYQNLGNTSMSYYLEKKMLKHYHRDVLQIEVGIILCDYKYALKKRCR